MLKPDSQDKHKVARIYIRNDTVPRVNSMPVYIDEQFQRFLAFNGEAWVVTSTEYLQDIVHWNNTLRFQGYVTGDPSSVKYVGVQLPDDDIWDGYYMRPCGTSTLNPLQGLNLSCEMAPEVADYVKTNLHTLQNLIESEAPFYFDRFDPATDLKASQYLGHFATLHLVVDVFLYLMENSTDLWLTQYTNLDQVLNGDRTSGFLEGYGPFAEKAIKGIKDARLSNISSGLDYDAAHQTCDDYLSNNCPCERHARWSDNFTTCPHSVDQIIGSYHETIYPNNVIERDYLNCPDVDTKADNCLKKYKDDIRSWLNETLTNSLAAPAAAWRKMFAAVPNPKQRMAMLSGGIILP